MIDLERVDPEILPRIGKLKAMDPGTPVSRLLFALVPFILPTKRVIGVTLTKERAGSVRVRVYRPDNTNGSGLLWIHGGGLVLGAATMDDQFCGDTAKQLGVTIVSLDYRLAPKHPFPAAHDDVYAAWTWFVDHLTAWGLDRPATNGGQFLALNVGAQEWNYQVKDLAEAVANEVPATKVSINTSAPPDGRSYKVDFGLFRQIAPAHQPREHLKGTIEALCNGLRSVGFADRNFRESQLIRLKVLERHMEQDRLSADLQWRRPA